MVAMGCTIWLVWDMIWLLWGLHINIHVVIKKLYENIRMQYILPVYCTA